MISEYGKAKQDLGKIMHYHGLVIELWTGGERSMEFWKQHKDILTRWDRDLKIIEYYENLRTLKNQMIWTL